MSRAAPQRLLSHARPTCLFECFSPSNLHLRSVASLSPCSRPTLSVDRARSIRKHEIPPFTSSITTSKPQSSPGSLRGYAKSMPPSSNADTRSNNTMSKLSETLNMFIQGNQKMRSNAPGPNIPSYLNNISSDGLSAPLTTERMANPHYFHIYAHRHNTHITVTDPNRNPIMSVSCGNIGFKHSGRKQYDAAYQLASYVMGRMQERGINAKIQNMELVYRGFGAGREAVTKVLLGSEGRFLRNKVIRVKDATRLKFGGTRSPRPRRLG